MDDNFTTLRLLLPDGYMAKVFHIPTRFIPESNEMIGCDVTLYGLKVFGVSSEKKSLEIFMLWILRNPEDRHFSFSCNGRKTNKYFLEK